MTNRLPQAASDTARTAAARELADTPRHWTARQVVVAVGVALVVGALLNAQSLLEIAERQPFGWQRDVAVTLATPLADASRAVGLDRPLKAIDVALGRHDEGAPPERPPRAAPERAAPADPEAATPPSDELAGIPSLSQGRPAGGQSPGDADGSRRAITAEDPLRMYVGGDSMVGQFGMAMEILGNDTGMIETTEVTYEFGSGLSRPDFIDWPALLEQVSAEQDPDVIVLYFGGNDAQPLEIDGTVREPEDPQWQAEYRVRVAALMDQLSDAGHHVYWMGLPVPRSDTMVRRFRMLNEIYDSEASERPAVTFVPSWDLFAGPDGGYSEYLEDDSGDLVDMRLDDGIHYTTAGAFRIARVAVAQLVDDFDIEVSDDG